MILCSSGVLQQPGRAHADSIIDLGPQLGADGIEVLVLNSLIGRLDDVAAKLATVDLDFPVVHAPKKTGSFLAGVEGIRQLEETLVFARRVGADVVVLHLWDLPESDRRFETRLEAATIAADMASDAGLTIAIETIPCLVSSPLVNVARVLGHEPRLAVALDTEFLAYHGELAAALDSDWLWADGRVRHIHLKDFSGELFDAEGRRCYRAIGEGDIDFGGFFASLEDRSYAGRVSLESAPPAPGGGPDVTATRHSLSRISRQPWAFA